MTFVPPWTFRSVAAISCLLWITFTGSDASALSLSLNTDWHDQSVSPGETITVELTLDTDGDTGMTSISAGILFDDAILEYRRDLSSTTSYLLWNGTTEEVQRTSKWRNRPHKRGLPLQELFHHGYRTRERPGRRTYRHRRRGSIGHTHFRGHCGGRRYRRNISIHHSGRKRYRKRDRAIPHHTDRGIGAGTDDCDSDPRKRNGTPHGIGSDWDRPLRKWTESRVSERNTKGNFFSLYRLASLAQIRSSAEGTLNSPATETERNAAESRRGHGGPQGR